MFLLIEVLLYFLKHLRRVLFLEWWLYLAWFYICAKILITVVAFDVSLIIRVLIFLLLGEKRFQFLLLIEKLYLVGHLVWFIVYFESLFAGPDKFILSVRFSFSIKGNISFFIYFLFEWFLLTVVFSMKNLVSV